MRSSPTLKQCRPNASGGSKHSLLDLLKVDALLAETADIKDELKRAVEREVGGGGLALPRLSGARLWAVRGGVLLVVEA
ncbi:hypothetical protein NKI91_09200 [Mesorhizobium sp. M0312]|uniref:hypothetical protein n=1 Tax=Mesorhizobium sp. M0312 TaxID=2956934 RepID=UPI0033353D3B